MYLLFGCYYSIIYMWDYSVAVPAARRIVALEKNSYYASGHEEATNRSKFIRTAIRSYLKSSKEERIREKLKKGYLNMAQVNLSIANMCISADSEQLEAYEEKLAESEK